MANYQKVLEVSACEDASIYHEKSRTGECLGSHSLKDFVENPKLYKYNLDNPEELHSKALTIGSATHSYILEPDLFVNEFEIGGVMNEKTGKYYGTDTKKQTEYGIEVGRTIIAEEDGEIIRKMSKALSENEDASALIAQGAAEKVIRVEIEGVLCQIRMDWFNPELGLSDLKTCQKLRFFQKDVINYGYANQAAFYNLIIEEATGEDVPCYLIAVEKDKPFECGVFKVDADVIYQKKRMIRNRIKQFKIARDSGIYQSKFKNITIITE